MVAIATVMLVITPISWILLHSPQSDNADASIPYITRDDDSYITASNEPVVATHSPSTKPTPGAEPTKPSPTPTSTPTPGQDPTTTPSDHPTTVPTQGPGDDTASPTVGPTRTAESHAPTQTAVPTNPPASRPPTDNGNMNGDEQQLFSLIDDARVQHGCAPLSRNSSLSGGARSDAANRADSNDSSTSGSEAAAVGQDMSAQAAFDKLKNQNSGTLLDCGLHELGVGRGDATYQTCGILRLFCTTHTRVAWVADFQ
jgi:uncharacterized protein YkwD